MVGMVLVHISGFAASGWAIPGPPVDQPISETDVRDAADVRSISERFEQPAETPDFQRHVAPLLGRLGCNGRACHGSFQGQGGFRLSLFGYDFSADHAALTEGRVNLLQPANSLVLTKPTNEENHEGGLRYEVDSWQYNLLRGWIESGAEISQPQQLSKLVVHPNEVLLSEPNPGVSLTATAYWEDGSSEDVTELCRFSTNDPAIAEISDSGVVSTSELAGDTHVVVSYDRAVVPVAVIRPVAPGDSYARPPTPTRIDELVVAKWEKLRLQGSELSDDAMFLRRVSLDITGTLPTPAEIKEFLGNPQPDKRQAKIESLLESPAYAAWWTTFFCDLTGNNTRQLNNVSYDANVASQQWYTWIYRRVADNIPYDQLVEGIVLGTSRAENESYADFCERMSDYFQDRNGHQVFAAGSSMPYYWMRREFQDRDARAISFAHSFLGLRIQCAQCHKHPFDQWTQDDFREFSKFFAGVSVRDRAVTPRDRVAERVMVAELRLTPEDKKNGKLRKQFAACLKQGKTVPFSFLQVHPPRPERNEILELKKQRRRVKPFSYAFLLGSDPIELTQYDDVRRPVMDWMRDPDNPFFARALVNRVWARYFGVGIVEPADDLNLANAPSNAPLLDYLAKEFVSQGYDLKWLHREITNSRTYQLSWVTNENNVNDRRNFSRALPRRLPAEVVFDAVTFAASNSEINRGFRNTIANRAISVPGTPARNQQNKAGVNNAFALKVFGRSQRSSSCDCDRSEQTSLVQAIYLQNDRDVLTMLNRNDSWVSELQGGQSGPANEKAIRQKCQALENRAADLRASLKNDEQNADAAANKTVNVAQTRKQLAYVERKLRRLKKNLRSAKTNSPKIQLADFVEEAYLRTLSRLPTEEESKRCITFIQEDDDLTNGLTGVLWALINTKEFVVNH